MARRRSWFLAFLRRGLAHQRYPNLVFEDASRLIFNITFPHRARMSNEDEWIFMDWYELMRGDYRHGRHCSHAKAALKACLRNSDYVEIISIHRDKYTCRILNEEESRERRRLRREIRHRPIRNIDPPAEPEHVVEQLDWF